jgi:N-acetylglutamate synthase-like GNAT family acetyltransferase
LSGFTVRAATPRDATGMLRLIAALGVDPAQLGEAEQTAFNTNLLRALSTPGCTVLVAEGEGRVLGAITVWTRTGLFNTGPTGLLDQLVVDPAFADSAVAAALVEQGIGACQALGCHEVQAVLADHDQTQRELLAHFGFEATGAGFALRVL